MPKLKTRSKSSSDLPTGAAILVRGPGGQSIKLAQQLAAKGASDALIEAIGGDRAIAKVRMANGRS